MFKQFSDQTYNLSQVFFAPDNGTRSLAGYTSLANRCKVYLKNGVATLAIGVDSDKFQKISSKNLSVCETLEHLKNLGVAFKDHEVRKILKDFPTKSVNAGYLRLLIGKLLKDSISEYIKETGTGVRLKIYDSNNPTKAVTITDAQHPNVTKACQIVADISKQCSPTQRTEIDDSLKKYKLVYELRRLGIPIKNIRLMGYRNAQAWLDGAIPNAIAEATNLLSISRKSKEFTLPTEPSSSTA